MPRTCRRCWWGPSGEGGHGGGGFSTPEDGLLDFHAKLELGETLKAERRNSPAYPRTSSRRSPSTSARCAPRNKEELIPVDFLAKNQ